MGASREYPHVVLDARMIGHSGIGSYIRGLLEGWREAAPEFRPALLGDPARIGEALSDSSRHEIVPFAASIYGIGQHLAYPREATRGRVLHVPHYNAPLRHAGPLVVTIHDLTQIHERWGIRSPLGRLYAYAMLRAAARRADRILTAARAAADEIVARLRAPAEKIAIVPHAPSRQFINSNPSPEAIEEFRRRRDFPRDYFLTVGLYKPHKNLQIVLETLKSLWENQKSSAALVAAGTRDKERAALDERLARLGIADRVRVLERLPAEDLPLLYRGARALVFASLLEGFGLPVVEAQAVGTPVVASNASAVPETAGDGALFFDPMDREDLARQLVRISEDSELREQLIARGRRNVERFSWPAIASKVLTVYEEIR